MNRLSLVAFCLVAAINAYGASASFDLTVAARQHQRNNVPVRVPIGRNQIDNKPIASVTVARANGERIPAQWTGPGLTSNAAGEVHFIAPHLAAGESLRL